MNFTEFLKGRATKARAGVFDFCKTLHDKEGVLDDMVAQLSEEMKSSVVETECGGLKLKVCENMPRHDWINGAWVARMHGTPFYDAAEFEDVVVRGKDDDLKGWVLRCKRMAIITPDQVCKYPDYKASP
jgi:hypothetical protein